MARIRTIKPEFFTSLTIADLPLRTRLTFIGLWTHVDDEGRCIADPRLIKAAVWPLDDVSTEDVVSDLGALTESSLIAHYEVGNRRYLSVCGWGEHQRINRPSKSKFPAPDSPDSRVIELGSEPTSSSNEDSLSPHTQFSESSSTPHGRKGTGNREQGKEKNSCSTAAPSSERAPKPGSDDDPDFASFWSVWRRRVGKGQARAAWRTAIKKTDPATIIERAEAFMATCSQNRTETRFIPHPSSWLNGERWGDEDIEPEPQQQAIPDAAAWAY